MGDVIFRLDWELMYEPRQGIEVHLRHGGSLSREVAKHLAQAGRELSLALQHLAKMETERLVVTVLGDR